MKRIRIIKNLQRKRKHKIRLGKKGEHVIQATILGRAQRLLAVRNLGYNGRAGETDGGQIKDHLQYSYQKVGSILHMQSNCISEAD